MNAFALELDKKVHIDANDSRNKYIYEDTDTIVKQLCEKLKKNHGYYEGSYVQRTGSIESGGRSATT